MSELQLQEGKSYYDRIGRRHGPLVRDGDLFRANKTLWFADGRWSTVMEHDLDLVREAVDPPAAAHAASTTEDRVPVGGLVNSKVPPYHLIPPVVFRVLAGRFQRGQQNLGDKAWNAQSHDQSPLRDRAALMERINHLQNHLLRLQEDLAAGKTVDIAEDPAAILWGAAFIVASIDAVSREGA